MNDVLYTGLVETLRQPETPGDSKSNLTIPKTDFHQNRFVVVNEPE